MRVTFSGTGQQFEMQQLSGGQKALVALALNPSMIEFFINELSVHNARDGFTEELVKLREDMKEVLWQRFAD